MSARSGLPRAQNAGLDREMLRALVVVAMFAAIAGGMRLAQDVAIAWRHGAGPAVDAFYFVNNIVNWPVAVALSTLTLLVSPAESALRSRSEAEQRLFRGEIFGCALLMAAVVFPLSYWALQAILSSPTTGLGSRASDVAVRDGRVAFGVVPLGFIVALFSAWLIASGKHIVNLLEAIPALVLVITLVAVASVAALFWGLLAGLALQALALALVLWARAELPRPRLDFSSSAWLMLWRGGVALLIGQLLFALVPLVDQFFAARLGDGVLASLSFANRLILGLQGLSALAVQRASLPLLSRLMTASTQGGRRVAIRWSLIAGCFGVLFAVAVAVLADPIVKLLFERGSFTAQDSAEVAVLLRYGMLQMPPFFAGVVLVTALASAGARVFFAVAAAGGLLVKTGMNLALVPVFGAVGLQLATAAMYGLTAFLAWMAVRRGAAVVSARTQG